MTFQLRFLDVTITVMTITVEIAVCMDYSTNGVAMLTLKPWPTVVDVGKSEWLKSDWSASVLILNYIVLVAN